MSVKELQRIATFGRVVRKELTLIQTADQLGISRRQFRRVLRRYEADGDAGLVHRLRGMPSTHGKDSVFKASVLETCRANYADFGPTLASRFVRTSIPEKSNKWTRSCPRTGGVLHAYRRMPRPG